jgi:hypothetical protein
MPLLSPTTQAKLQGSSGGGNSARDIYGQRFAQMAQASFNASHAREQQYLQAFHVVDADPDTSVACGVFILRLGDREAHVPAILNKNELAPFDVMLLKDSDTFVPFNLDWINMILGSDPGSLGDARKPPDTLSSDVDIRNLVVPPRTGRYSYASAQPLIDYLMHASNEKKASARALLSKHPKLAQFMFKKYAGKLEDSLRAQKVAVQRGLTEAPVVVLSAADPADHFKQTFQKHAAQAYVYAQAEGFAIRDMRPRTKVAVATEGMVRLTQVTSPGMYRMHLRDGSTRVVYVTDRAQSMDSHRDGTHYDGRPMRGEVVRDSDCGPGGGGRITSTQFVILTDKGEICLWRDRSGAERPVMEIIDDLHMDTQKALQDIANAFTAGPIRTLRPQDRYATTDLLGSSQPSRMEYDDVSADPDKADEDMKAQLGVFVRMSGNGRQLEVSQPFSSLWDVSKSVDGEMIAKMQPINEFGAFNPDNGVQVHFVDDPSGTKGIKVYGGSSTWQHRGASSAYVPNSFMMLTGTPLDASLIPKEVDEVHAHINAAMTKAASASLHVLHDRGVYQIRGNLAGVDAPQEFVGEIKEAAHHLLTAYDLSADSVWRTLKLARSKRRTSARVFSGAQLVKLAQDPATQGAVASPAAPGELIQDPNTGMLVDPATGQMFDPSTGQPVDPAQMGGMPPGQGMPPQAPAAPPAPPPMDMAAQDVLTVLQAQVEETQKQMEQQMMMAQAQAQAVQSVIQRAQMIAQGAAPLGYNEIRSMVSMPTAEPQPLDIGGMPTPQAQQMPQQGPMQQMPQQGPADMADAQRMEAEGLMPQAADLSIMTELAADGREDQLITTQIPSFLQAIDTAARSLVDLRLKQDRVAEELGDTGYRDMTSKLSKTVKIIGEVTLKLNQQAQLMRAVHGMESQSS